MSPGQNVTRTKCHRQNDTDKMSQDKMSQDKMSHGQNGTGQNVTGQNVTQTKYHTDKMSPGQNVTGQNIPSTNHHMTKLNKTELPKMAIFWDVRLARDILICELGVASCELGI